MRACCWRLRLLCFLAVLLWTAASATCLFAAEPPRVLGFERFGTAGSSDVAAGELLLGELNCTSCHQANDRASGRVQRKPAPVLDSVCSRVKPQYVRQFLADPQAAKPGTTMPNVLAGLSERERDEAVEALVHFLATTGTVMHANPMRHHVNDGERLFHAVGCVACHDPRTEPDAAPLKTSIPLGTPSRKYTLPGLAQFLENPLAVRPGGRMPHLALSPAEARNIASFLLNDLDIGEGLQYAYYEGSWDKMPEFARLKPVATGDAVDFNLDVARRKEQFALRFEGTIQLDKDGDYLFLIGSDDGSRLLIDGKLIVDNDGIHPFQQRRKKVPMKAGLHTVVVEYFEQNGEESLQVDVEPPGGRQQPLVSLLAAPVTQKGTAPPPEEFAIDDAKAERGRELFVSLGCAACHTLRINGLAVTPTTTAKDLVSLAPGKGCLSAETGKLPHYGLSPSQRTALSAAIAAAKSARPAPAAAELVHRTMVRMNCYACHEREGQGSVEEARNVHFQSDMPEMGDEGRIPPHLTGVGAKLSPAWLRTVFEQGAKDRPYMFTRMPKFGMANVGELVAALDQADADRVKPSPSPTIPEEDLKRFKAAGRRLVGAQGFSCIKCHTFADKKSTGIQALSLTTMTKRLRPEWFHHYLLNPQAYRPGTRMPTAFPDGQTTLPTVLDGDLDLQTAAIWSYLSDGDQALLPVGLVTGEIELVAFDEAVLYRNFIEGAGPRGIGVGYPEKLNLAFDANDLRLAMLWHGGFIDAARHWTGRGAGFEGPLGDNILRLPEGPPLAILSNPDSPWPAAESREQGFRFRGYRLGEKQMPTFLYSWNGMTIEDYPHPAGADDVFVMQRTLKVAAEKPVQNAWLRAVQAGKIEQVASDRFKIDDRWFLTVAKPARAHRRQSDGQWELLVPVTFNGEKATIELTYDW